MSDDVLRMAEGAMPPGIPDLADDAREAVSALANAAFTFRGVFTQAAEGTAIDEIMAERAPYLLIANKVVDAWCDHFGIDGT